jgi:group I intron endonuclease
MSFSGIYKIVNNINGKVYVGSSKNLQARKRSHYCYLRGGKHPNKHLQSAWEHYGEENFSFEIVCYCEEGQLATEERRVILECESTERKNGYNISDNTTSAMTGLKHSLDSIEKMRNCKIGSKNQFYGKKHSESTKNILREKMKGRELSEEHKQKILETAFASGENNVNSILSDQQVDEIREQAKIYYEQNKTYWGFDSKIARIYNVNPSTIGRIRLNKIRKKREN